MYSKLKIKLKGIFQDMEDIKINTNVKIHSTPKDVYQRRFNENVDRISMLNVNETI